MHVFNEAFLKILYRIYQSRTKKFLTRHLYSATDSRFKAIRKLTWMLIDLQKVVLNRFKVKVVDEAIKSYNKDEIIKSYLQKNSIDNKISNFSDQTKKKLEKYPKITVVTPNYNQGRFLEKCIQSVLSQNYSNLEYIIIDGGSTDNSVEIIKRYENKIRYWVSEKDNGQADAINKGLKYATGEIFNWLNSDDYLEPDALFKCAEAYQENPSAVGWIGACRRIDDKGNILNIVFPNGLDRENIGQNWNGRQFYQPSCFLSTARVKEIGGVNPNLHFAMDLDLWIRILEKGEFVAGRGIWSNAIIHADAKTQKLKENMHLETIDLQKKYNFIEGANNRYKSAFNKGNSKYVLPGFLKVKLTKAKDSNKIDKFIIDDPITITFISDTLPLFDKASSNFRVFNILKILLSNNCKINYLYSFKTRDDSKYLNALNGDIKFTWLPFDQEDYQKIITEKNDRYVWVTNLWSNNYLKFIKQLIETLKARGAASKFIIDTMDFHYKKYLRKYEVSNKEEDLLCAIEFLQNEKILYHMADNVIVVTENEKNDLIKKISGIKKLETIPNIHEISDFPIPYKEQIYNQRNNICFIGNFNVNHNVDAVRYFLKEIFQFILKRNPFLEFHIIGNNAEKYKKEFSSQNVKVIGFVKDIEKVLENYKLFVCPMTYGTGMKGKIGSAAAVALPIVTTSIGAEGFPIKDGEECFIADSPIEFAEKCDQCLSDPIVWNNFSIKLKLMIAENFSINAVSRKLAKIFST